MYGMKTTWMFAAVAAAVVGLTGCETVPPGVERGPHGTIAYEVLVEASEPGAQIEANGEVVGQTPIRLKIFGDRDGTFHDFGSYYYVIKALPLATNQFSQVRLFGTGHLFGREDHIPSRIHFDMNQPPRNYETPMYGYPDGPPPYYYAPPPAYYGPAPYYYGPSIRFNFGPGYYHRRWH
jgi:hypothetical protein